MSQTSNVILALHSEITDVQTELLLRPVGNDMRRPPAKCKVETANGDVRLDGPITSTVSHLS